MIVPIAARLAANRPTRREHRSGYSAGTGLYLVKVSGSPYGFTFSDEWCIRITGRAF